MTAAVLPATSFMSMPLTSSDRHGDYYPPTHVQHHIGEHAHQAYFSQKANDFRLAGPPQLNTDPRALPPGSAHTYTPIHASPYTSSPASVGPSASNHQGYGPISNSSAHAPTSHPVYVDSQSRPYVHSHHPGSAYAQGVSPEMAGAGNMMKPPHYPQLSPIATLPSPSMYGRPQQYSWTPTSGYSQHNYVHQPGTLPQRASFSVPQSATTPTYSRYSQPSTPVVPREASAMYTQLPSNIPHITIPRQPTVGTYQSPAGPGPLSGKDISPTAGSTNANGAAAPGPIPATIPKILQDSDGVQRIVFEYSKDKHRTTYQIRCDTNTVDVDSLPLAFKEANLVYPRAYRKENYGGNRYSYESECNNIGWALTHLNPELRENRGATQRAVDSWRNSSSDPKMRSRRVRRQAKQQKRVTMQQQVQQASTQAAGAAGKSVGMLATQRPLVEGAAKDSHQYQLPAMKSEDDLKDVSAIATATTSLPPTTSESRYSTAHLQQTQYMPQDEHTGGGGGGMMVHSTYNAAQEYGGGQQQHQAVHAHAHAQGEYGATSYATQAGATHYGQYT